MVRVLTSAFGSERNVEPYPCLAACAFVTSGGSTLTATTFTPRFVKSVSFSRKLRNSELQSGHQ